MGRTPARSSSEQYVPEGCARPMFLAGRTWELEEPGDTFAGPSSRALCCFLTIDGVDGDVIGMRQ